MLYVLFCLEAKFILFILIIWCLQKNSETEHTSEEGRESEISLKSRDSTGRFIRNSNYYFICVISSKDSISGAPVGR